MATDFAQWMAGLEAKRAAKDGEPAGLEQLSGRSHQNDDEPESAIKNQKGERTAEENLKELKQEMKLLRWHKLANEAALKAAIIKTKRLKGKEAKHTGATRQLEKAAWMQQVIQEEQGKPLEVTEDFIREYQGKEAVEDHRVEKDMKRHLTNLKRVKENFEQRAEIHQRNQTYKEKKLLLDRKAQAIADQGGVTGGKALPPIGASMDADPMASVSLQNASSLLSDTQGPLGTGQKNMAKVVSSLDRLMELEKRISLLERDADDGGNPARRSGGGHGAKKVVFAKQRVAANAVEPARTKYHVRVNRKATGMRRGAPGPGRDNAHGHTADLGDDSEGTFMTSLPAIKPTTKTSGSRKSSSLVPYENKPGSKSSTSRTQRSDLAWPPQYDKKREVMMRNLHGKSDGSVRRQKVVRQSNKAASARDTARLRNGPTSSSRGVVVRGVTRGPARLALADTPSAGKTSRTKTKKTLTGRNSAAIRGVRANTSSTNRYRSSRGASSSKRTSNATSKKHTRGGRGHFQTDDEQAAPKMPQLPGFGLGVVGTSTGAR
ncbi:Hypothetical Protein FCC1311_079812 [Hondaea fermentalgiana]|uniref:Uncharacterized protein n=1 Tax=Hondaea fermentalgiana TaxID=2315210 RepID=A0A2R5GLI1_9STRA|nr:Hypothetical Protein FCC1311_079812 [Hondaea fermentalgiana]|eukprot:GBG31756.1 Hypothetical Protein FCC1311_079812 [Hondaea fermentalgiana]